MIELFQYLFSDLTANMRIMASRISLSLMILMDEDRVHCEEKKQWKTASTWQNRVTPVQLLPRLINSVPICAIHYENEPLVEEKT